MRTPVHCDPICAVADPRWIEPAIEAAAPWCGRGWPRSHGVFPCSSPDPVTPRRPGVAKHPIFAVFSAHRGATPSAKGPVKVPACSEGRSIEYPPGAGRRRNALIETIFRPMPGNSHVLCDFQRPHTNSPPGAAAGDRLIFGACGCRAEAVRETPLKACKRP